MNGYHISNTIRVSPDTDANPIVSNKEMSVWQHELWHTGAAVLELNAFRDEVKEDHGIELEEKPGYIYGLKESKKAADAAFDGYLDQHDAGNIPTKTQAEQYATALFNNVFLDDSDIQRMMEYGFWHNNETPGVSTAQYVWRGTRTR